MAVEPKIDDSGAAGLDVEVEVDRHGNWVSAFMHISTAIIGAGVLTLPYTIAVLGWIGGFVTLFICLAATKLTTELLARVTVADGVRYRHFGELVYGVLGARSSLWLSVVQNVFLALVGLGYSITAAEVMRNVARSCCTPGEPCFDSYFVFAIIFGLVQCVLAQTPSMDSMAHMSVIGAATSLAYSLVAIGLSFAAGDGGTHTLRGKELPPLQKMFAVFNAVGLQSSAYVFIMIQVEIFDTIKTDAKGPAWHMSRAINFALLGTTILYVGVAASGYLAFGVDVCHNVLSCVQNPAWAIRMGNILVLIHMVPAYQLYMQPFYQMVERNVRRIKRFPPRLHGWPLRLSFRTAHTVANTIVTIAIPFFGDIIGLVGACTFFPCMYFPLQLYKVVRKPSERVRRTLNIIVVIAFFVTLMSAAGSVQQIVVHSSEYTMFG